MTRMMKPRAAGTPLTARQQSLAFGVPPSAPGTIYALALSGGIALASRDGHVIAFGRNRPQVQVCVGEDDPQVSRQHGVIACHRGQWQVSNTGKRPIRLGGLRYLFPGDEPVPLPDGYTPLLIAGSAKREHLLEIFVTGPDGARPVARHAERTRPPRTWSLKPDERLALIVLAQQYLYHDFHPQPLSWAQAAEQLAELQPCAAWGPKRVEHLVADVRDRLSRAGVAGLTREEVGEPVGNALKENLIRELMHSTTLVPRDLAQLDERGADDIQAPEKALS